MGRPSGESGDRSGGEFEAGAKGAEEVSFGVVLEQAASASDEEVAIEDRGVLETCWERRRSRSQPVGLCRGVIGEGEVRFAGYFFGGDSKCSRGSP